MQAKIYTAVPSGRDWKPLFGNSLASLMYLSGRHGIQLCLNCIQGNHITKARQLAVRDAIAGGFSHILFFDDDMKFPPDTLIKLLRHDVDAVSINYVRKDINNNTPLVLGLDGLPVSSKGKNGIEEIGWIGFGGVLIKLELLKQIPDPIFSMPWIAERNDWLTEDFFFCKIFREHGGRIFVDHDLSNQSAHIGDFYYKEV